jgi:hypothetical protein
MSTIAKYLVNKHYKIAQVVLPASVLFGFVYTLKTGQNPLHDLSSTGTGIQNEVNRHLPMHSVSMRLNLSQLSESNQDEKRRR